VTVLVTGASGFLGRHLVHALLQEPGIDRVVCLSRRDRPAPAADQAADQDAAGGPTREPTRAEVVDVWGCDLTDHARVRAVMAEHRPAAVFHLAANPLVKADDSDPCRISRDNILATPHVLAAAPPGARFALASSASVYGNEAVSGAVERQPLTPNAVYGATKVAAEALAEAHDRLGKVRYVGLRLVANVGAGATHGVVRDFVRKAQSAAPEFEVLGDRPGSTKHYAHAGDTAAAFVHLALRTDYRGPVNVANDDVLSTEALAALVMAAVGVTKPVRWLGEAANWRGDNRVVAVDSAVARRLGWVPRYPRSADAVRRGVADMLAHARTTPEGHP
jgi:UDP-glucose 4-epimerase